MNKDETINQSAQRFELQKVFFKKGFDQIQKQIIHLDDILFKIKASAITVWVALIGWALTASKTQIVPLGVVIIIRKLFQKPINRRVVFVCESPGPSAHEKPTSSIETCFFGSLRDLRFKEARREYGFENCYITNTVRCGVRTGSKHS